MGTIIEACVPDIGDYRDVPVVEVLVGPGDRVEADTTVVVLESDKATLDIPSGHGGTVAEVLVKAGDLVSCGSAVLKLRAGAAQSSPPELAQHPTVMADVTPSAQATRQVPNATASPSASKLESPCGPAVRRLARELGVDLVQVLGSGPKGRLLKEDVLVQVRQTAQEVMANRQATQPEASAGSQALPAVDLSRFGPVERMPRTRLQQISSVNLARNWASIPHVTNFDAADITTLEAFRREVNAEPDQGGVRLTLLPFLLKAAALALQGFPAFNSAVDGGEAVVRRYWHVGFAVDSPNGLLVPVVRDVDKKGLRDIAQESDELVRQARAGKLRPEQMQGGCFTVSNLGSAGGSGFTPIINAPEVAILGVAQASMQPVWEGAQFQPRLMLPLCLSWDHRAVDGVAAARFLGFVVRLLADYRRAAL